MAIADDKPDKLAEIGDLTASEWVIVFSLETEQRFVRWIRSMNMLQLILDKFKDLGSPELVATYPMIIRNLNIPSDNWPEVGPVLGRTASALGAIEVARKHLLPKVVNKNFEWVTRLHLIACLAEMGVQDVRESIETWIDPRRNVGWGYTTMSNALETLKSAAKDGAIEFDANGKVTKVDMQGGRWQEKRSGQNRYCTQRGRSLLHATEILKESPRFPDRPTTQSKQPTGLWGVTCSASTLKPQSRRAG